MKGLIFVLLLAAALNIASASIYRPEIISGSYDEPEFNFDVGLIIQKNTDSLDVEWCGGSLISPEWIVTAAHCVDGADAVTAYLGSSKKGSGIKTEVLEKIIHSEWDAKDFINNIALLRIAPVTLGSNISIVNLPPLSSSSASPLYEYEITFGSVWGKINDNGDIENLYYSHMRTVPNSLCSLIYGTEKIVERPLICAVNLNSHRAKCPGDTAASLVIEKTNTLIALSNLATSAACNIDKPAVFTRISSFRSWILEKTGV